MLRKARGGVASDAGEAVAIILLEHFSTIRSSIYVLEKGGGSCCDVGEKLLSAMKGGGRVG